MTTLQLIKIMEERGIPSSFEKMVYLTVIALGTGFKIRCGTTFFVGGLRFTYSTVQSLVKLSFILDKIGIHHRHGNDDPERRVKGNFVEILTKISRSSIKGILDHSCVALKFGDKVYIKFISKEFEEIYRAIISLDSNWEKEDEDNILKGWYHMPKKLKRYVRFISEEKPDMKCFKYLNPTKWAPGGEHNNHTVFFIPEDGTKMSETIFGNLLSNYGFSFHKIVYCTVKNWNVPPHGYLYLSNIHPSIYSYLRT